MIPIEICNKLIDSGYSLICADEKKVPVSGWGGKNNKPVSKDEFYSKYYCSDKSKIVGIVTGHDGLEVIDVDLKVFASLEEQKSFWNELISFIRDNIDDFDSKFIVVKTMNRGYHIIYKCSTPSGNEKIAKLKGHEGYIIESRGVGGYVVVYQDKVGEKWYNEVARISDEDREILWNICKTYNYTESIEVKHEIKEFIEEDISPWVDFNSKNSVLDIAGSEFTIVRQLADKYIIKRNGAKSPHSGYVYKNSGLMYLFSTGTIYPNEKPISPFCAYAYKNFAGDFKRAASDLYEKGYGTRRKKPTPDFEIVVNIDKDKLEFPIDIFPAPLQMYITESSAKLNCSIDYMGCSLLWAMSVIIGNSMEIEVKKGWTEKAILWVALVGKAGIGKTPSISKVVFPLEKANNKEIQNYIKQKERFDEYDKLDKNDKKNVEEVKRPKKSQFIVNDITSEALVDLHQESLNALGVFKDELAGWFKDMNKYRAGSDLEFWLSTWSGKSVNVNRKTSGSSFVEMPFLPVLGGIQPTILESLYTEENKENGFMDRILLSYPELGVDYFNEADLSEHLIKWYKDLLIAMYEHVKINVLRIDENGDIDPYRVFYSVDGKKVFQEYFNAITDMQNSDTENEYLKSMLPKQKSYINRFALIIHFMDYFINEKTDGFYSVNSDSVIKAKKLSFYFIEMAKKIKVNNSKIVELKNVVKDNNRKTKAEIYHEMKNKRPDMTKKEAAEILGVTIQSVYKWEK